MRIKKLCLVLVMVALAACGGAEGRKAAYLKKGQAFFESGGYEKARVEFKNALQIDPKDIPGRYMLAQTLEKLGDVRGAAGFYLAVIEADPKHRQALAKMAQLYLMGRNTEEAGKLAGKLLELDARDPDGLVVRAGIKALNKDTEGALADASAALAVASDNANAAAMVASLKVQAGKPDEAISVLLDARQKSPKNTGISTLLARLYNQLGRKEDAEKTIRDVINQEPAVLTHRMMLAQLLIQNKDLDGAETVLKEAVDNPALTAKDANSARLGLVEFQAKARSADLAIASLQDMIKADADNFELKLALGKLFEAARKPADARKVYEDIIEAEREPTSPQALSAKTRLALVLARGGDAAEAKAKVNEVLQTNATDLDALLLRGTLASDAGDPGAAIGDFRAALKNNPDNIEAVRLLARAHLANKEPQLAIDVLLKAVNTSAGAVGLRAELANAYAQQNQLPQALEQLDAILKLEPANRMALEGKFKIRVFEKKWDEALAVADAMKTALPKDPSGFYFAGLVYQGMKKLPESIEQFESALAVSPDAVQPLSQLIKSYLAQEKPDLAEKRLREALEQNERNFVAHNLLGELSLGNKRFAEAAESFKKALKLNEKWAIPYRNLATAQLAQKEAKAAIATMRDGIQKTGGSGLLLTALATYFESVGKLDEAIAEYDALLKEKPQSLLAVNNLAMLLVEYRSDAASLKRARELAAQLADATEPAFLDTAGWVEYKNRNYQRAAELLEKAVAGATSDVALMRYHLGMSYLQLGNKVLAKDNLQAALDADGDFRGKEQAREAFAKL